MHVKSKEDFTPMECDLGKHAEKQIWKVCLDSFDTFRIAEIRPYIASILISTALLDSAARVLAIITNPSKMPPDIGKEFAETIERYQQQIGIREKGESE